MIEKFSIPHGFDIRITKNIPIAGGMAGGSTDAAAVMRGINEICNLGVSIEELMELGVRLGADIPFCIQEKPALAEGIGEILTPVKGLWKELYILLVNPNVSVSTKEIYQKIDSQHYFNKVNNSELIKAIFSRDFYGMKHHMQNVMQIITEEMCPPIRTIINTLEENGALVALMSGSGATCYGIFDDEYVAKNAQKIFTDYFTAITHPVE